MKRNQLKRIVRQISEVETAIGDLPIGLREAIEQNHEVDCVVLMDALSALADSLKICLDDDEAYSSRALAEEFNPGKKAWYDEIGMKSYIP